MKSSRLATLALVAALAPGLARADDVAEAKEAFVTASRFFQAEEYAAALPLFEKAYRLSGKRPVTIFGLAQCERSLKKYEAARAHFEEYLATGPDDEADVRETIRLLDDLIRVREAAEAKRQAEIDAQAAADAKAAAEAQALAQAKAAEEAEAKKAAEEAKRREAAAAPSETAEEPLAVPPPPPAPVVAPPEPQPALTQVAPVEAPEEEGGVLSSPWFWTIASVVLVSGAVTGGVLLARGGGEAYGGSTNVVLGD